MEQCYRHHCHYSDHCHHFVIGSENIVITVFVVIFIVSTMIVVVSRKVISRIVDIEIIF